MSALSSARRSSGHAELRNAIMRSKTPTKWYDSVEWLYGGSGIEGSFAQSRNHNGSRDSGRLTVTQEPIPNESALADTLAKGVRGASSPPGRDQTRVAPGAPRRPCARRVGEDGLSFSAILSEPQTRVKQAYPRRP